MGAHIKIFLSTTPVRAQSDSKLPRNIRNDIILSRCEGRERVQKTVDYLYYSWLSSRWRRISRTMTVGVHEYYKLHASRLFKFPMTTSSVQNAWFRIQWSYTTLESTVRVHDGSKLTKYTDGTSATDIRLNRLIRNDSNLLQHHCRCVGGDIKLMDYGVMYQTEIKLVEKVWDDSDLCYGNALTSAFM